jgi:hypothetical protein
MNLTVTMIARLIHRDTGAAYHGEFEAPLDPADALIRAHERFGAEYHIRIVYPEETRFRIGWHEKLAAAMLAPPLEGGGNA